MEQLYRWVKASEREPEATNGYAKDIVYRVHRDSGTRLIVSTVNQLLDTLKYRIKEKYEWLEPIESEQDELWNNIVARIAAADLMAKVTPGDNEALSKWKKKAIDILSKQYHLIKK